MSVSKKLLRALDVRDGHVCAWTGVDTGRLVPHHRANRGHGGRPSLDRIANLVWLDSFVNGLLESDPAHAAEARKRGIKISSHADPEGIPVTYSDGEFWLTKDGRRVPVGKDVEF